MGSRRDRPADIPPIQRRPILDVGLALVALVVLAFIVLATTEAFGARFVFVPATQNPWPAVAWLFLAFCIPTVCAVTFVVLRDVLIPRGVRYAFASEALVSLTIVGTLCALCCFGDPAAFSTFSNRTLLDALLGPPGILWMIASGFLFGLSLPAVHSTERARPFVRRSRRRVTLYVLAGLCVSIACYMYVRLGPPSDLPPTPGPPGTNDWVAWFKDLVALPAVAFQTTTLIIAILGRFVHIAPPPRRVGSLMVSMPLVAWGAVAVGGALAGGTGFPPGIGWPVLVSCVFAGLGVTPGLFIASMWD